MNSRRLIVLLVALAAVAVPSVAFAGDGPGSGSSRAEAATARRTNAFFRALETQDRAALRAMLSSGVTWSVPMAANGDNDSGASVITGVDAVIANFDHIGTLMRSVSLTDRRVTVGAGGRTSIVEARGDFVTVTGAPYRNVYVFRLDWRNGTVVAGVEYANPVTICRTFPMLPGCP